MSTKTNNENNNIKVFKFGGASIKNAEAVINIGNILKNKNGEKLVIVLSAMDKTTNNLEKTLNFWFNNQVGYLEELESIKTFHNNICLKLFDGKNQIYKHIEEIFSEIESKLSNKPSSNYDYEYDQIISYGEIISTTIVSKYLDFISIKNTLINVFDVIKTDSNYRDANVDWIETNIQANKIILPELQNNNIIITQGFISKTKDGNKATLGREGSDYSASIIANCINAESVTIWKDVPGVLNADPKWFDNTIKIDQISYKDAIELSYYGATIIHPKTLKPLQNKKIPLFVKSFVEPNNSGTIINDEINSKLIPSFIFKVNQTLITISPKDLSFIIEQNLSEIFQLFSNHKAKINIMHNSALSFSVCVDEDNRKILPLIEELKNNFNVKYNTGLELVTIRNYNQETIERVCVEKEILLEQKSRTTVQIVVKPL